MTPPPSAEEIRPAAVAGRLIFVAASALLLYGLFFHLPRMFVSTHETHFAGFYAFSLATSAAAKRTPLLTIGGVIAALAIVLEVVRSLTRLPVTSSYLDGVGDLAGVLAALGPMSLQKIRAAYVSGAA